MAEQYSVEAYLKAVGADQFSKAFSSASKEVSGLEKTVQKMESVGKNLTKYVTTPLIGVGTASVMTFTSFDDSMRKVEATMGSKLGRTTAEVEANVKALRDEAQRLGSTTAFSASEAARGMEKLALAGWDTNQILEATGPMLNLASAAAMDLDTAADIVTDTMASFQMEASRAEEAADIFAKTSSSTNTDVMQLGEALKYAAGEAHNAGLDLAETNAVLGYFANTGLKGSMAGTTFTSMLNDMRANAKDGAIAIGEHNIALYDSEGNMRNIIDVMADVERATEGMDGATRDAALSNIFGQRAMKGVNSIMAQGTDGLKELSHELQNADGTSRDMAEHMEGGLGGAFRSLKSALEGAAITIGEVLEPYIRQAAEAIADLALWFENLDSNTQRMIVKAGALAAALGPVILITAKLISGFMLIAKKIGTVVKVGAKVIKWLSKLRWLFTVVRVAMLAIMSVPGLIIAAILVLVYLVYKYWDEIVEYFEKAWEWIKDVWESAVDIIKDLWNGMVEWFKGLWDNVVEIATSVWDKIKEKWNEAVETLKELFAPMIDFFGNMWETIKENATQYWDNIKDMFSTVWENIKTAAEAAWELIKNAVLGPILLLINLVTGDMEEFKENLSQIWENIKESAKTIWDSLKDSVKKIVETAIENIKLAWDTFKTYISGLWNSIKETASNVFNRIKEAVKQRTDQTKQSLQDAWDNAKTTVIDIVKNIWRSIKDKFNDIKNSVQEKMNETKAKIEEIWGKAEDFFRNIDLKQIGIDVIQGFINGIKSKVSDVAAAAQSAADAVTGKIKSVLGIKSPSRVLKGIGTDTGDGFEDGILASVKNVAKAAEEMALAAMPDSKKAINATKALGSSMSKAFSARLSMPDISGQVNGINRQTKRSLAFEVNQGNNVETLLRQLLNKNQTIVLDTGVLVGETTPMYNQSFGNKAQLTERWGRR
ncbi:phage tail tape measure protein [Halalkalibacterium halodurans]|uniref:phage tail tape measure protein n=1 Tax=Halalkalibacterium halodurans TaxID=86665 RepID=UPI002E2201AE|nr:phage tail tape measure protein [Halalkalibacterium halodurans]MED4083867.1 phage tail tape measure protein [Halalkalibacterium halodurans]MED4105504.1 phage tail tape measure protein [Halalkalibacterium halodurans]MED4109290.1 phage tail tape measure protein [Halalkalibacterium halodurans]MED4149696.1 phage tail tape measure protein [Halalkalibacterium halodurans]